MIKGSNPLLCIGRFSSPHGVKGDIKLTSYTQDPLEIFNYQPLYCKKKEIKITIKKPIKETFFIVQVKGITNRELAVELTNQNIFIHEDLLPEIENADEFYYHKIKGASVFAEDEQTGKVENVCDFGAGTFLEIKLTNKKLATLPFNKDAVLSFDEQSGIMKINKEFLLV